MSWEYHTEVFDSSGGSFTRGGLFDAEVFTFAINRLGWERWELVSIVETNRVNGSTKFVVAVFKRPLTPERRAVIASALETGTDSRG